ncbi:hypothetical protein [Kitasatospora sp. HPMI-4]|uniref:hypothetical protein n=1 Tax=Kitasatospora sp. HPMI-4 TaxID=3448443 RepID=UPI003F1A18D2
MPTPPSPTPEAAEPVEPVETVEAAETVETAALRLASDIACALRGAGTAAFRLERHPQGNEAAHLGAVRTLGADALAPFAVGPHSLGPGDVALLTEAVRAFPAPPPLDPVTDRLWGLRDWALHRTLTALGVSADGWDGLADVHRYGVAAPAPVEPVQRVVPRPADEPWPDWTAGLAQLSSLALPGLHCPQRDQARRRRLDLGRGLTHALLRRDLLRAARLARWLALDSATRPEPLLSAALAHIEALAVDRPRTLLETALARRAADTDRSWMGAR